MAIVSILALPLFCVSCIPRYKPSLRGTEYIEHSDRLSLLNEGEEKPFILSKKYVFTKTKGGFPFSKSRKWDIYAYGVFSHDKKELIPTKYRHIWIRKGVKTGDIYIACFLKHDKWGHDIEDYFKIENNKAVLLEEEPF